MSHRVQQRSTRIRLGIYWKSIKELVEERHLHFPRLGSRLQRRNTKSQSTIRPVLCLLDVFVVLFFTSLASRRQVHWSAFQRSTRLVFYLNFRIQIVRWTPSSQVKRAWVSPFRSQCTSIDQSGLPEVSDRCAKSNWSSCSSYLVAGMRSIFIFEQYRCTNVRCPRHRTTATRSFVERWQTNDVRSLSPLVVMLVSITVIFTLKNNQERSAGTCASHVRELLSNLNVGKVLWKWIRHASSDAIIVGTGRCRSTLRQSVNGQTRPHSTTIEPSNESTKIVHLPNDMSLFFSSLCTQNPNKPNFNHYLFEAIAVLIRTSLTQNPASLSHFEDLLFPVFTPIFTEDVAGIELQSFLAVWHSNCSSLRSLLEFVPYVLQIIGFLLESHPTRARSIPDAYRALFASILTPSFWDRSGNIPALSRLLQAYIEKAGENIVLEKLVSDFEWRRARSRLKFFCRRSSWVFSNGLSLNRNYTITKALP